MKRSKIKVGENEYNVRIASTEEELVTGLAKDKGLGSSEGLILDFSEPVQVPITTKEMSFPISVIFISDKNKVQAIKKGTPGSDKDIAINKPSRMVLEVTYADGIKTGDDVMFIGSKDENGVVTAAKGADLPNDDGSMHVLDENGEVQMSVDGDERVYSRTHTKQLYRLAEQAEKSKDPKDYRKVGRAVIRIINKQNTQKQEYVKE